MHVPILLSNDTVIDQVNVLRYNFFSSNTKNVLDTYKRECSGDSHRHMQRACDLICSNYTMAQTLDIQMVGQSEIHGPPCCGVSEDSSLSSLVLLCTCVCECTHAALCACMGERACACSCASVCLSCTFPAVWCSLCHKPSAPSHSIAQQEAGHICWLLCLVHVCGCVCGWWWGNELQGSGWEGGKKGGG